MSQMCGYQGYGVTFLFLVGLLLAVWLAFAKSWRRNFDIRCIEMDEIISGGTQGRRSLNLRSGVRTTGSIRNLVDTEPVVIVGDDARAYPLRVLMWHEIVNDKVGSIPVPVTFCPLCNAVFIFDRRPDDMVLDFSTTGRLRNSDLVIYDRQTECWRQ